MLSDDHKRKLAEGRRRRAQLNRTAGAQRAVEFRAWSATHARVWAAWQINCGRAQHDCTFCREYRQVTASIPYDHACADSDFEYARDEGLL